MVAGLGEDEPFIVGAEDEQHRHGACLVNGAFYDVDEANGPGHHFVDTLPKGSIPFSCGMSSSTE